MDDGTAVIHRYKQGEYAGEEVHATVEGVIFDTMDSCGHHRVPHVKLTKIFVVMTLGRAKGMAAPAGGVLKPKTVNSRNLRKLSVECLWHCLVEGLRSEQVIVSGCHSQTCSTKR
ncbi:hypothetical protein [Halovenus salina]|uniref:Uncharacterized protein n=1 Tax=Halovenus salina TaxID=1510225 RepID=A0ABD5W2Z8_9EURY